MARARLHFHRRRLRHFQLHGRHRIRREPPPQSPAGSPGARVYDLRAFGAKGDGKTLEHGGGADGDRRLHGNRAGIVLVPGRRLRHRNSRVKSNVTLHIAAQGKLLGTADGKQYHAAEAIPLSGDSTLGMATSDCSSPSTPRTSPSKVPEPSMARALQFRSPSRGVPPPPGRGGSHRPYHLLFHRCRNLTVRDIFLTASAFHSVRVIQSSFVKLEGLHIHNRVIHNTDGFHFISSQNVQSATAT